VDETSSRFAESGAVNCTGVRLAAGPAGELQRSREPSSRYMGETGDGKERVGIGGGERRGKENGV